MDQNLSCALFDLDNTLTDRDRSIDQFSSCFLLDFQSILHERVTFDEVLQVMRVGDGGGYRPKEIMFQEIQAELQWLDTPTLETISEYWYRVSAQCMQLRPGTETTLEELVRRGYTLGIITNGKTIVQNATIDAVNIRKYFSTIVISEASGFRKPDPYIFQLALSHLQCDSARAAFVGDHPHADIEGARNAGLHTIWFAGMHPWTDGLPPAEHHIEHMPQLLEILA